MVIGLVYWLKLFTFIWPVLWWNILSAE